jgi:hypothetical protein
LRILGGIGFGLIVCAVVGGAKSGGGFVAHEWGTFTSVQGGDGVLLDWHPLQSSHLPQFVYDWTKAGLDRFAMGTGTKARMVALQRMETPVIYFYADKPTTVDVSVRFPQGRITEWYPQAAQIGPSMLQVPPWVAKLDMYAYKAGVAPTFRFSTLVQNGGTTRDSRAQWKDVTILPFKQNAEVAGTLPVDRSGSHYFAARETDSDYLRINSLVATNPSPEVEKFIFYRGAGSFATPLRVTMESSQITIANAGQEPLLHLVVLNVQKGTGTFVHVARLAPGEKRIVPSSATTQQMDIAQLSKQVGDEMAAALESQGLYRREATAMVGTWRDSWFEEDGVRVLYLLPREWTDRTLPLDMEPAPRELVRVMVGRAEVLTPALEQNLAADLTKAQAGDGEARARASEQMKKLGRFAELALRLATQGRGQEMNQMAWDMFWTAARADSGSRPL